MKTLWTIYKEHIKRYGNCHCRFCQKVIDALDCARDKVYQRSNYTYIDEGDALVEAIKSLNRGRISRHDLLQCYGIY